MKKILTAIILSSLLLSGCGSKNSSSSSEKSEPTTVVETTEETNTEPILEFRMGETKDGELILTEKDIADASPVHNGNDAYSISLQLTNEAKKIFADATVKAMEEHSPIAIWYKGEMICCPTVNSVITNGLMAITGDFDINEANEIAEKICPSPTTPWFKR